MKTIFLAITLSAVISVNGNTAPFQPVGNSANTVFAKTLDNPLHGVFAAGFGKTIVAENASAPTPVVVGPETPVEVAAIPRPDGYADEIELENTVIDILYNPFNELALYETLESDTLGFPIEDNSDPPS